MLIGAGSITVIGILFSLIFTKKIKSHEINRHERSRRKSNRHATEKTESNKEQQIKEQKERKRLLELDFHIPFDLKPYLTEDELQNIEIYGQWLSALEHGRIEATTPEEMHFLKVISGEESPINPIESAWMTWKQVKLTKIPCKLCAGKGHYTPPNSIARVTCERCHGFGVVGVAGYRSGVEGTY
ncbi:hypothetical protein GCM10025791_33650 [Halioxenophilus aromaticivorans]|uniref:Macrodomain Ori protein n=2 Tax=Halioxenophilus aromaticivorans TaxID=1306992 RepID=A0AAV3U5U7_9ALTE